MPRLGDAYDEATDEWERRRLYFGAALLFVGAVVAAPGLARVTAGALEVGGLAEATALTWGIAFAAFVVPIAGAALLRWVPASPPARTAGAAGVVLATIAVAAFVVLVPPAGLAGPTSVPAAVIVTYVVGAMLALWSPIVAAGLAASQGTSTSRPETAFVRDTRSIQPGSRVPADGGEDEEQLAFLLDRED